MGKCILIGAGDLTVGEIPLKEDDFVIAVDGGLAYCGILNIEPDMILGDFDSVGEKEHAAVMSLKEQIPERIIELPREKDDTDMLYAIKYALELGYRDFRIYAGMGGRFDHSLANVQCLLYLKNHDACGYLMGCDEMIMVLKNETIHFKSDIEGGMSLLCLGQRAEGVHIHGMKYNVEKVDLTNDFPVGISNEFVGEEAEVSVENGELVCIIRYVTE